MLRASFGVPADLAAASASTTEFVAYYVGYALPCALVGALIGYTLRRRETRKLDRSRDVAYS
ncbi:hypothetical protein [Methylobacterium gnaphalii]|nr:hypothetical protein [Methylobacterium gnaphalii]